MRTERGGNGRDNPDLQQQKGTWGGLRHATPGPHTRHRECVGDGAGAGGSCGRHGCVRLQPVLAGAVGGRVRGRGRLTRDGGLGDALLHAHNVHLLAHLDNACGSLPSTQHWCRAWRERSPAPLPNGRAAPAQQPWGRHPSHQPSPPPPPSPCSMRPVATVPRPLMENTSSTGMAKGLSRARACSRARAGPRVGGGGASWGREQSREGVEGRGAGWGGGGWWWWWVGGGGAPLLRCVCTTGRRRKGAPPPLHPAQQPGGGGGRGAEAGRGRASYGGK